MGMAHAFPPSVVRLRARHLSVCLPPSLVTVLDSILLQPQRARRDEGLTLGLRPSAHHSVGTLAPSQMMPAASCIVIGNYGPGEDLGQSVPAVTRRSLMSARAEPPVHTPAQARV